MQTNSPKFIMTVNYGEGKAGVGFMSKDASIETSSYLVGRTICAFFKEAAPTEQAYLKSIHHFLSGMEDEAVDAPMDEVASKEEQTIAVKQCCGGKKDCCGQKKKTTIKKVVKKKK